jgi:hypothetical protein
MFRALKSPTKKPLEALTCFGYMTMYFLGAVYLLSYSRYAGIGFAIAIAGLQYLLSSVLVRATQRTLEQAVQAELKEIRVPTLCMRMDGDEAIRGLGLLAGIGRFIKKIHAPFHRAMLFVGRGLLQIGLFFFIWASLPWLYWRRAWLLHLGLYGFVASCLGCALLVLAAVLAACRGFFINIGSAQEFVGRAGIAELGLNSQFADG